MSEEELARCPICHSLKTGLEILKGDYWLGCNNCGLGFFGQDKNELIKKWNTRHQPKGDK